jgi:dihydrofolate reductase
MTQPELLLIAAVARNGAIGLGNQLLWNEPADQRHFRETTQGHAVLMGRKTWDSLPPRFRPLPNRRNVVLSRQAGLQVPGAELQPSLQTALQALQGEQRVFVIGGGNLYAQALPLANELVLTEIDADLHGDVFFPAFDRQQWQPVHTRPARAADGTNYSFVRYRRMD